MNICRRINGIVIIEGKMTMETVGFISLEELAKTLKNLDISSADKIMVHIQRGDGADG